MLPLRSSNFTKVTATHLGAFKALLSDGGKLIDSADDLASFNRDWLGQRIGKAPCALLPTTTAEVSRLLAYCNEHRIAVVPQAGNTGLVFGGVPVHDEVVLSLRRMNKALDVHPETFSATCDAGVILHDLHVAANKKNMIAPLDLGARGSCCIGGNVATAAGGIHFARYGSMHANTLGLRVVLANGQELDMMSSLRKDNTGYDLKKLFVGSEGTLGVITQAELRLHPLSHSVRVAVVRVKNFSDVLRLHRMANERLAEILAAFEVIDAEGLVATRNASWFGGEPMTLAKSSSPSASGSNSDFAVLIETRGANEEHDMAKLVDLLEAATQDGVATDMKIASTSAQNADLWRVREEMPINLTALGPIFKFDLCFPLHNFYLSVDFTRELLRKHMPEAFERGDLVVSGYGHFGDGNVHLNVVLRKEAAARDPELLAKLKTFLKEEIYGFAAKSGGSVSAEHGIGEQKRTLLAKVKPKPVLDVMRAMKQALDPNGILNPYKVVV